MNYLHAEKIRQVLFIALILVLGATILYESEPFIPAILGAITLYVLSRPFYFRLTEKYRWNRVLSAVVIMIGSFIIILLPVFFIGNMLYEKLLYVVSNTTQVSQGFSTIAAEVKRLLGIDIASKEVTTRLQNYSASLLTGFIGGTLNTIINVAIMYLLYYFMLVNARNMEQRFAQLLPLQKANIDKVQKEIENMVMSNALGIPLMAIVQAVFGLVGYLLFSIPDPLLWAVITGLAAMLPVLGTPIIWIPLAIYDVAAGETAQGIGLLIYGVVVILNVDNIFRMLIQKKLADVHPLITAFGVMVGVNLFGFVGLIFGPLLLSLFLLLIRIYQTEFVHPPPQQAPPVNE